MVKHRQEAVTNFSVRCTFDSLGYVIGENGRDIVFRDAGLERVIKSPPGYTWDKEFTNEDLAGLMHYLVNLVGIVGAQGILRQVGYRNAVMNSISFGLMDDIKDFPPREKFRKSIEILSASVNRGRVVEDLTGLTAFDVFDCGTCEGRKSTKPFCSIYAGTIDYYAEWSFGKGKYITRETRCKAMGDDTCLFVLQER